MRSRVIIRGSIERTIDLAPDASAISDEALLLGKIGVSVVYGWVLTIAILTVMLIGADLREFAGF